MKFVNNVWLEQSKIYCCRFLFTRLIYLLVSFLSFLIFLYHVQLGYTCSQPSPRAAKGAAASMYIRPSVVLNHLPSFSAAFPPPSLSFSQVLRFFSKFTLNFQLTAVPMSGLGSLSLSLLLSANDPGRDSERGGESISSSVPCPPLLSPGSTGIRIINTRDESRLMCI